MVVGIFALIISVACFWFSLKFIKAYFVVKQWPKVEATVLVKNIKLHEKVSTARSPYKVDVHYSYRINNTEYRNNKVYLTELIGGQVNHMKQTADRMINRIENKMQIFVNPKNPKQSVMFCEGLGLYIFVFFIGLISLIIGLSSF